MTRLNIGMQLATSAVVLHRLILMAASGVFRVHGNEAMSKETNISQRLNGEVTSRLAGRLRGGLLIDASKSAGPRSEYQAGWT